MWEGYARNGGCNNKQQNKTVPVKRNREKIKKERIKNKKQIVRWPKEQKKNKEERTQDRATWLICVSFAVYIALSGVVLAREVIPGSNLCIV